MSSLAQVAAADEVTIETREASPAHFLIKIDSFSLLDKHGIDKLETSEFESGGYKWRLIIYPNGHGTGKDGEGYVSVYLAIADTSALPSTWKVNAVFSICLFNHKLDNYRYVLGRARRFHALKPEWGFDTFISKKELVDPSNGYRIDDICVFGAEVFVNENKAVTECLSLENVTNPPYKREFKISNFSTLKDEWISDEFTAGGFKWNIVVSPNGDGHAIDRYLSAFLVCASSDNDEPRERVCASYTICIKNQMSDEHHVKESFSYWFSSKNNDWGSDTLIELASLKDPNKGFIVKDCCLLEIELTVVFAESTTRST